MIIAALDIRRGVRNSERNPRNILSGVVRLGARWRDLLWMIKGSYAVFIAASIYHNHFFVAAFALRSVENQVAKRIHMIRRRRTIQ